MTRNLTKKFKLWNDKRCDEKIVDVVGPYLDPPDKALAPSLAPHLIAHTYAAKSI